jgi:folate-binding protein YgfZ
VEYVKRISRIFITGDPMSRKPAFFQISDPGLFYITGEDRFDFLQRQTTNDIYRLTKDNVLVSVLTNPNGRILDVFHLFVGEFRAVMEEQPREAIYIISLPGRSEFSIEFLRTRIFFMDKVEIFDVSHEISQFKVFNPLGNNVLAVESSREIAGAGFLNSVLDGVPVRKSDFRKEIDFFYSLICEVEQSEKLISSMNERGFTRLTEPEFERIRIRSGIPGWKSEYVSDYTPLEMGLAHAVSYSKGCFTGQEVLARQMNYDKVTRRVSRIRASRQIEPGNRLYSGGTPVGEVTSSFEELDGSWTGIGVLKKPYDQPEVRLANMIAGENTVEVIPDFEYINDLSQV